MQFRNILSHTETLKIALNNKEIMGKVRNTTVTLGMALRSTEMLFCPSESQRTN